MFGGAVKNNDTKTSTKPPGLLDVSDATTFSQQSFHFFTLNPNCSNNWTIRFRLSGHRGANRTMLCIVVQVLCERRQMVNNSWTRSGHDCPVPTLPAALSVYLTSDHQRVETAQRPCLVFFIFFILNQHFSRVTTDSSPWSETRPPEGRDFLWRQTERWQRTKQPIRSQELLFSLHSDSLCGPG